MEVVMILAGAIPRSVPKCVIQFGGERKFTKKIAERGFVHGGFPSP
jgi:hypothetical protein